MNNQFYLFLLCIFISFHAPGWAYVHNEIRGMVEDAQSGTPISGALILIEGKAFGAETDENGTFSFRTDSIVDFISVSHVSYAVQRVEIRNPTEELLIRLQPSAFDLEQVVISAPEIANLRTLSQVDIQLRPVRSAQDVLRIVPGLITAQHAGGGKAEQIFLRGFDIDHGTDVAIEVDGLPVNMVSHAHGQGYADIHFVIPELIQTVDFGKGPYYAERGDFTTAGYVSYQTRNWLDRSLVKLEAGQFGSLRGVVLADLLGKSENQKNQHAYVGLEYLQTDGPFESPQNFNRLNLTGKFHWILPNGSTMQLGGSTFTSRWDASGQIPQRAVDQGIIGRFGAIDDTEGGHTGRTNFYIKHRKPLGEQAFFTNQVYYSRYNFELYSNFTFFLNDPINGDQIRQREKRDIFGYRGSYQRQDDWGRASLHSRLGFDLRHDRIQDNELSNTRNRQEMLLTRSLGDVFQTNVSVYADERIQIGPFLLNGGIRADYFRFEYYDRLDSVYQTQSADQVVVSPKLNLVYQLTPTLQLYLKNGIGFHSNDARVVVTQQAERTIPLAFGNDLGVQWKPSAKVLLQAALWHLFLQQEFVYVGDEAVVEAGNPTRRLGVDFSARLQPVSWLFLDADLNYAYASFLDADPEADRIPLAPRLTSAGGLGFRAPFGLNGAIRFRYIQDRPANEDNSVVALGYTVFDLNLNYTHKRFELSLMVENLFDTEWNEAQFDTESRLFDEPQPVSELHFTPGYPFFIRAGLSVFF